MDASHALFIAGLEKSGKTPLRRAFEAQPFIRLTRGTTWERHAARLDERLEAANVESFLHALDEDGLVTGRDAASVRLAVGSAPATRARILGLVEAAVALHADRTHWGVQWAEADEHVEALLDAFPDALVVHLVRDPRDLASASSRSRVLGGLGPLIGHWLDSVRRAERNGARFPGRCRVLRYEDLVADPAGTVQALCQLLGERSVAVPEIEELFPPGSVGRFRSELAPAAVAYVEGAARDAMAALGYAVGERRRGLGTSVRLAFVTRPLATLRSVASHARGRGHGARASAVRTSTGRAPAGATGSVVR